jgi:threonine dehydrogenase-like Zn-dependent dehydrogenase
MPKTAFKTNHNIEVRDAPLRELKDDEIRIQVLACGICGTDLLPGEATGEQRFGHEMTGRVIETGTAVHHLSAGQTVVIESATACGRCDNCRNTRQELCTDIRSFFHLGYFGFAGETIVPAASAIVCEDLTPEVSCLSEPLGVAIDMFRLADIGISNNVLVSGCGPIGLMAIALARKAGARRIFAVGRRRRKARMELALQFGADEFIATEDGGIATFDFPCEVDRFMVTSPPSSLNAVFDLAAKGSIVSFIGIGAGEKESCCNIDINDFHFKKLQLRASFASPALFTPLALSYLRNGVIDGEALISHRFPLEKIESAMETARNDPSAVKVMVQPGKLS